MSTQPLSNSQRAQAISEIDRRIDNCLQELQSLRSQRNCLASQTQYLLPPDILLSIFLIYQTREVFEFTSYYRYSSWPQEHGQRHQRPLPYLLPSHVCVHWRRITLDFSPFWSILFLNNTKWIKELLIRSKTSPLRLHLQIPQKNPHSYNATTGDSKQLACLKMALTEKHRFESLDLNGSQDSSFDLSSNGKSFIKALKKALPSLYHLRFGLWVGYDSLNFWNENPLSQFTDHLWRKLPSMLRSLEIYAVSPASVGSGLASNLLTRLECIDVPQNNRPQVAFYLKLLGRLPALEVLILDRALPSNPDVEPPEIVTHASLKHLSLRGGDTPLRVYAQFLKHLTLPPLALLHLNGRCNPTASNFADPWNNYVEPIPPTLAELREVLSSLFLALQPYFTLSSRRLDSKAPAPFHSLVIESIFNGFSLSFARENKIIIDKVCPLDNPYHFWEYTHADIKLELSNLAYLRSNPTDSMNVGSDTSRVVVELLHDIVQTVEHAALVENAHHGGMPPPSLEPWIVAFSESTALKELDLKLTTSFQSLLSSMMPVTTPQLSGETPSLTFPVLEKIMVLEVNFLAPPPLPETLENENDIPSPRSHSSVLEARNIDETGLPPDSPLLPHSPSPPSSPPSGYQTWQKMDFGLPPRTFFLPSLEGTDFPNVFRARKAAGHFLRTLSFHNCAAFDPSISLHFADAVEEVRWDGLDSNFWDLWPSPQVPYTQGLPAGKEDQSSSEESDEEPQDSAG
ncbi:hypothetical protein DL96DRAFT_1708021 [Flagelloscypha sp. PMI_526]|nr:hypothetical protein DL96DRAFT_1708021 [Flagelloscypha sp. PMI_526]